MTAAAQASEESPRSSDGISLSGFWRLYEIHRQVQEGRYPNCTSLANDLEVHRRTIERDIGRLRDFFGAPIAYDSSKRGYYYTEEFSLPSMRLREGEAVALFLGQKLLAQCKGTPFEELVKDAMKKVRLLMPQEIEENLQRTMEVVSFHVEPLRGEEEKVSRAYETLVRAIEERRSVAMNYFSAGRGELTHRLMDPYHLRLVEGAWYCIGYCHERREVRTFALDRVQDVEITENHFEVQPGFSIEKYLADSLAIERGEPRTVVIEFVPSESVYIQGRTWHKSQKLESLPGGGLRMTLTVGGLGEVKRWVMSLGANAWVVEPPELREEIRRELEATLGRYR